MRVSLEKLVNELCENPKSVMWLYREDALRTINIHWVHQEGADLLEEQNNAIKLVEAELQSIKLETTGNTDSILMFYAFPLSGGSTKERNYISLRSAFAYPAEVIGATLR